MKTRENRPSVIYPTKAIRGVSLTPVTVQVAAVAEEEAADP